MRRMIAKLNQGYRPDLIVMDGIEAFTDGGPSQGTLKRGNVVVAGTDRVAVDAVGLSILKELGSNEGTAYAETLRGSWIRGSGRRRCRVSPRGHTP